MTVSKERKTQNEKILEGLAETKTAISDLNHTMQLFAQEQKGEHCNINKDIDEMHTELFGNGGKQRLREMVNRLWEDAKSFKDSAKS